MNGRRPPLDRVALVAAGLLLPGCLTTAPGTPQTVMAPPAPYGQLMPPVPVEVAKAAGPGRPAVAMQPVLMPPPADLVRQVKAEVMAPVTGGEESTAEPPLAADAAAAESPLIELVRCYVNKSPEQAAQRIRDLAPAEREMLARLLPLAVKVSEGGLTADPHDLTAVVDQLQALLGPLKEKAELEIPKLCFCKPIPGAARFGAYIPIEPNHVYRPGEVVGVYVEVRNFACAAAGRDFRTQVATSVEVHDEGGEVVYRHDFGLRTDPSLSARQDYCQFGRFALPTNLPTGAYSLWVKVADAPTGRSARKALDFEVAAAPRREGAKER